RATTCSSFRGTGTTPQKRVPVRLFAAFGKRRGTCETSPPMPEDKHPGRRLRDALAAGTAVAPGAFNAPVARAVAGAGFKACYISGAAAANTAGYPDIGLVTLTEMCRTIREIAQACGLPVIADADTGFGEEEAVARTVVEYERTGAAALHLEDQV